MHVGMDGRGVNGQCGIEDMIVAIDRRLSISMAVW